ncbi:uncharacterized protein AMSG_02216 [Thecamonas trahens ATCC 50062]|uniref:Uncharacterized protein n=1 Tax=Thecamonas trahens ATCC 50062 TaxID=461836 RepID=A0A0L0DVP1_THETB|nr:hypothetical protein AMSG_02216 [Thecamonas trahens ATCC 50062]KNC56247.1 hypothetical protein AMSG_02216 [Thecamonas trahens ATCC 50062]|eukprot:XP_013760769.1 hypothetical protein AMSG_02216 [Thecamonas trahens ATCC 50062]
MAIRDAVLFIDNERLSIHAEVADLGRESQRIVASMADDRETDQHLLDTWRVHHRAKLRLQALAKLEAFLDAECPAYAELRGAFKGSDSWADELLPPPPLVGWRDVESTAPSYSSIGSTTAVSSSYVSGSTSSFS